MPIYEYECKRCGHVNPLLLKVGEKARWWRHRCAQCGSRRLKKRPSTFAARRTQSMADTLSEMSKLGPVRFVPPSPHKPGPPPGGCPYAKGQENSGQ